MLYRLSPAFIVGSVGFAMLGSVKAGWFLLASQFAAGLICGFAASRLAPEGNAQPPHRPSPPEKCIVAAVRGAVFSMAVLCGYIILFSFLAGIYTPAGSSPPAQYAVCLPLEVTAACQKASTCAPAYRVPLCMAALSLMGACVFLQVRALTHPNISLRPLALSRIAHLPLCLAVLAVLMHLFPVSHARCGLQRPCFHLAHARRCSVRRILHVCAGHLPAAQRAHLNTVEADRACSDIIKKTQRKRSKRYV